MAMAGNDRRDRRGAPGCRPFDYSSHHSPGSGLVSLAIDRIQLLRSLLRLRFAR